MRPSHALIGALLSLCWLPSASQAEVIRGTAVKVLDGDTLSVSRPGGPILIRLMGVDCPEKDQPFGARATELASQLVLGRPVVVQSSPASDGPPRGKVSVQKVEVVEVMRGDRIEERKAKVQVSLEEELVKAGLAWCTPDQADATLARLEKEARRDRRGLWAGAAPVAPWDWRAGKRAPPAEQGRGIRITNRTAATVVVDLTPNLPSVTCEARQRNGKWTPCELQRPFCMEPCGTRLCPECAKPAPRLVRLAAGKSIDLPWEGKLYRVRPFAVRKDVRCSCQEAYPPPAGLYRIGLCVEPQVRGAPKKCFRGDVQLPSTEMLQIAITS